MVGLDEAFIQAPEHRPKAHHKHSDDYILSKEIPTIDLSSLQDPHSDKAALTTEIAESMHEMGVFPGDQPWLVVGLKASGGEDGGGVFQFTIGGEKRRVKRDEVNPMGYHDGEHTKNVRDWKEIFDFFLQDSTTVPASTVPEDTELRKLTNPWPQNPSTLERCAKNMQENFLRFNRYPPCPNPELALGVGRPHRRRSYNRLGPDNVGGLQVSRRSDGQWISVKPNPDAFIITLATACRYGQMTSTGVQNIEW
ncbi:2-oxoglutarate (2OG) and Fe(II)-dependent oxygenase superfamily protein [Raphanus sativus]|nr:2-oxoglutarate (2OG) and Fe(II)-dependent oxygenase superfamily protein [Raphanus sativus]